MEFLYTKLSKKRLEQFKPSKTLGDELRIQRNYYDITSSKKTTTSNKSAILNSFLKNIDEKEVLNRIEDIRELNKYLDDRYKKTTYAEINVPSRITELEKELNPKLKKFTRSNYFTSYYCLFRIYGFLDFNSFLKLLKKYDVKYKYSNIKMLELPKNFKTEFNILTNNRWGYNFYSFIVPLINKLNDQEKVEISLNIGEPSYFIKEILDKKITTITYDTAKKLLNVIGIKLTNNHTIDELLYSFGMLSNEDIAKGKKVDKYLAELDFERYQEQNNLIPVNFNYIYNKNSVEDFTFLSDLKEMIAEVNHNLQEFVDTSCSIYNVDSMLNAYKVLTTLKNMSKNMLESSKLLSLPLNEDIKEIIKYYENNIQKNYYARPFNITLLDDIEQSEDGEIESLNVCIPRLVVDIKENSNKYKFTDYFKEIYSNDMSKKDYGQYKK